MSEPIDKHGRLVAVGSHVRILELSSSFLASLPEDEIEDIRSMIGEVFKVCDIDDYGSPWVMKEWSCPESGQSKSHSLALNANEMELLVNENTL